MVHTPSASQLIRQQVGGVVFDVGLQKYLGSTQTVSLGQQKSSPQYI